MPVAGASPIPRTVACLEPAARRGSQERQHILYAVAVRQPFKLLGLVVAAGLFLAACGKVDNTFWPRTTPGITTAMQAPSLRAGMGSLKATPATVPAPEDGQAVAQREPLLVIAADEPPDVYEPRLKTALSQAQTANPAFRLEIVAVSPLSPTDSGEVLDAASLRSEADPLLRRLEALGISGERVHLSARASEEVSARAIELYGR